MAGIGFVLRRLAREDTLSAKLRAYTHAASVSCGPWLFTVLCLAAVQVLARSTLGIAPVQLFSVVIIYNFAFSLVLSGPVVLVVTRTLADSIYAKDVSEAPGMFLGALTVIFFVELLLGLPFYFYFVDLTLAERAAALINFMAIGGIWLTCAFLSALKSFSTISTAFAVGMAVGFIGSMVLAPSFGTAGMLFGFTAGLAMIFFSLAARVFAEYPHPVQNPFGFLTNFRRYWEFALVGLFYNAAIWIDKWVMWFAPGRVTLAGAMPVNPAYDGAMFLAYLTTIPTMTVFLISIETRFFDRYLRFYRQIENHATAAQISEDHHAIMRTLGESARSMIVLQAVVAYVAVLVAPGLIGMGRGGLEMVPIYRFGVMGAMCHVLLLGAMVVISYFDLRRVLLTVSATFFLLNLAFAVGSLWLGAGFQGYGYFLAALLTLSLATILAISRVIRLPYMTFIANNQGLR